MGEVQIPRLLRWLRSAPTRYATLQCDAQHRKQWRVEVWEGEPAENKQGTVYAAGSSLTETVDAALELFAKPRRGGCDG